MGTAELKNSKQSRNFEIKSESRAAKNNSEDSASNRVETATEILHNDKATSNLGSP